ncbi:hypothetical protein ID866_8289 [Astraeus odoratus]|nr:hypothetical protein ID866_8289 [Astraeus odoratus]
MAQGTSNSSDSYESDPILQYRPPFAQSLPVQILTNGIVVTLVVVLLLHLIFTAQYHYPLARLNYILQLTGVLTLLTSLIATLYIVLSSTAQESQHWPYMLSYIAVDMPRASYNATVNSTDPAVLYQQQWSFAEMATWAVMNATTSVVVQITHVHFLTLLYPSDLEAKLIIFTLGPIAVLSAVMQLLPLISGPSTSAISEGTRNVCNATLSLLFTSALIIWGCFVNRKQAWRTDGGTAAFGVGAIILALISTSLNFIYIPRQDQYAWMPKLMWAVVLWQSFLGWWWWAGAGMGVREVEELLAKEQKRQQRRKLKAQRRKEQRERAKSVWKGVTSAFRPGSGDASAHKRRRQGHEASNSSGAEGSNAGSRRSRVRAVTRQGPAPAPPSVGTSTSNLPHPWLYPVHVVQRWYARLRHDHLTAAHLQAVERVERIHQVYGREDVRNSMREPGAQVVGWGLGSYGLREAERERRVAELGVDGDGVVGSKPADGDERSSDEETVVSSDGGDVQNRGQRIPLRRRNSNTGLHSPSSVGDPPPPQPGDEEKGGATGGRGWSSIWWWGPLRKWRLQDSTTYR